MLTKLLIN